MTKQISSYYQSWGRIPQYDVNHVLKYPWSNARLGFDTPPYLAYGNGRSYGDSCLNENGILIDSSRLNHILSFDKNNGIIRCEAGVRFDDILSVIVPHGWFLPVTPGTRFITVGGAVANDVHGKNHHRVGSFGNHVIKFELLRSDGKAFECSSDENVNYFNATIGGLGLTGYLTWVEFSLKKIVNSDITAEKKIFSSVTDFFELDEQYIDKNEYSVAWIDTTARSSKLGRGVYFMGDHATQHPVAYSAKNSNQKKLNIPFNFPGFALNKYSVKIFNEFYFRMQQRNIQQSSIHFLPFFYPLDNVLNWNRMYGKNGFYQHQCVVPLAEGKEVIIEILKLVSEKNMASFLSVLKRFGNIESLGMLSFPREGYTLALDFPNRGKRTLNFLNDLDNLVKSVGGGVYPAKDSRMSRIMFETSFPEVERFKNYIDPAFSSSFWRRVTT